MKVVTALVLCVCFAAPVYAGRSPAIERASPRAASEPRAAPPRPAVERQSYNVSDPNLRRHSGTEGGVRMPSERPMHDTTREKTTNTMREAVKMDARQGIEGGIERRTHGEHQVTSRDRSSSHPLASPAHARGAVDVKTDVNANRPKTFEDARAIQKDLGPHYRVIVEQAQKGPNGGDIHTTFNGDRQHSYEVPARASGDHIHIQPQYGVKTDASYGPAGRPLPRDW